MARTGTRSCDHGAPDKEAPLTRIPQFRPVHALCLAALALGLVCARDHGRVGAPDPAQWPAAQLATGGRIDGVTVGSEAEARFRVQGTRPGGVVRVETATGSTDVRVVRAYTPFHLFVSFATALLFWSACFFIFAARSESEPARTFLWASLGYGLAVVSGAVHFPGAASPAALVAPLTRMASLVATPVLFLRIAFLFPRPDPQVRGERLVFAMGALAAILIALEAGGLVFYAQRGGPAAYERFIIATRLASGFLALLVLCGSGYLASATRRAVLTRERQQVKWVAWGSVVGAFPFGLLYALPAALGRAPLIPLEIARLCAGILPVSYAIAVARYQFLDIDVIIRRSLLYGSMAALLTVTYLLLAVYLGGPSPGPLAGIDLLRIGAAGGAVALFTPTRRILGQWIDRAFFKLRTDHHERAASFRAELLDVAGPATLGVRLEACVRDALQPTRVVVRLDGPLESSPMQALAGATSRPEVELEPGRWSDEDLADGIVLVQPLAAGGAQTGTLRLGPRASGRRYVEEDLAFLATVGEDAGRALDRLNLVRRAAEESLRRAERDALDRQKNEFLSQVAHDLRTPLTSILWSAQNVLDGVAGPVPEAAAENVRVIRGAASHLGRLVNNLLEIARLETDAAPPELERVAAGSIVTAALTTLGPIARAWNVAIVAELPGDLPALAARREGLARIVINLTENALKYSPPGSAVTVALRRVPGGRQELSVRDHGPGIPPGDREAVFERFRRGRGPSAHDADAAAVDTEETAGPGLGLGLAVVRAWMDRCGGTVVIEAPSDGGARFVCQFNEWTPAPEEEAAWPAS